MLFDVTYNGETWTTEATSEKDCRAFLAFFYGVEKFDGAVTPAKRETTHDVVFNDERKDSPGGIIPPVFDWDATIKLYESDSKAALDAVMQYHNVGRTEAILMISEKY